MCEGIVLDRMILGGLVVLGFLMGLGIAVAMVKLIPAHRKADHDA